MKFYPPKIGERFDSPENSGSAEGANAIGTAASFACGCFVRLSLAIEKDGKEIRSAKFQTNGCGYMIAAADVVTERLVGRRLTELHGLAEDELDPQQTGELEKFPENRSQCSELVLEALRDALADFRDHALEEFQGEKVLICTCFGVSEETIEKCIAENSIQMVADITDLCRAGGGCGSCRMLIQEMLDRSEFQL